MQAMNLHSEVQGLLLVLQGTVSGLAQGKSVQPQSGMSFSSMLEHADKTYSTEGKTVQTTQNNSSEGKPVEKTVGEKPVKAERTVEENRAEPVVREEAAPVQKDVAETAEELEDYAAVFMTDPVIVEEASPAVITDDVQVALDEAMPEETVVAEPVLEDTLTVEEPPVFQAGKAREQAVPEQMSTEKASVSDEKDETVGQADEKKDRKTKLDSRQNDADAALNVQVQDQNVPAPEKETALSSTDAALAAVNAADTKTQPESKITVVDERTHDSAADRTFSVTSTVKADGNAEMVMTLPVTATNTDANGQIQAGYTKAEFSQMLSNSIEASADEFVKTGSIVLQDNKKGSINLILHPEELGNVKIKLELSDNQITGKIVVASKEAYDAFKQNIESIRNAFAANGFDAGGFDLAWAGAGNGDGSYGHNPSDDGAQNTYGMKQYGMTYEDNIPDDVPDYYAGSTHINLVA